MGSGHESYGPIWKVAEKNSDRHCLARRKCHLYDHPEVAYCLGIAAKLQLSASMSFVLVVLNPAVSTATENTGTYLSWTQTAPKQA
jgi:hypothetical protein